MKGGLIVCQSGGTTGTLNASLCGVIECARRQPEITNIYGALNGIEGLISENLIDLSGVQEDALKKMKLTPSAALGICRMYDIPEKKLEQVIRIFQAHDIHYYCYIGGNGSILTPYRLAKIAKRMNYPLFAVAVPKTIDNDLAETDHTPGYGSAARFAALAGMHQSIEARASGSVDRIRILEVPGRYSGWLVAATTLGRSQESDGPHLVYFPETPPEPLKIVVDVKAVLKQYGFCTIAIAEGVYDHERIRACGLDPKLLGGGGAGIVIAHYIEQFLPEYRYRIDKPRTLFKSSLTPSSVDSTESHRVGEEAVKLIVQGETGKMVTLKRVSDEPYRCTIGHVSLDEIIEKRRDLPLEFINEERNNTTPHFAKYGLPLIGEPLPSYEILDRKKVEKKIVK